MKFAWMVLLAGCTTTASVTVESGNNNMDPNIPHYKVEYKVEKVWTPSK